MAGSTSSWTSLTADLSELARVSECLLPGAYVCSHYRPEAVVQSVAVNGRSRLTKVVQRQAVKRRRQPTTLRPTLGK